MIQTRDELRQVITDGIDRALSHPFFLTSDQKAVLNAQRAYWSAVDAAPELDKLLSILNGPRDSKESVK